MSLMNLLTIRYKLSSNSSSVVDAASSPPRLVCRCSAVSMAKGKLSQRLRTALELAAHLNRHIRLYDYDLPAVVSDGELQGFICNSTEQVQVMVKCEGCCYGRRHYRKCTPKALGKKEALSCKFCMVVAQLPVPPGLALPYPTEQRFMAVVWSLGIDEQFCYHVVPPFWHKCMDFFNYTAGYYVQVDGSCHWTGMHQHSCVEVLTADFEQARSAASKGGTVVRLHEADLQYSEVVATTLANAQGFVGVVLSPSYAHQQVPWQGQSMPYTQALLTHDTTLTHTPGHAGEVLISRK